jgi:hypothetical protein
MINIKKLHAALLAAKDAEINCAAGVAADKTGLLVLDKVTLPRTLMRELEDANPGAFNLVYGTARADEANPKLLVITVNRLRRGVAQRVAHSLRGSPFNKVRLTDETGETDDSPEQPPGPAPSATTGPEPSQQPKAPTLDAKSMISDLAGLIERIKDVAERAPEHKSRLSGLAMAARSQLSVGQLEAAKAIADTLRQALDPLTPKPASGGADPRIKQYHEALEVIARPLAKVILQHPERAPAAKDAREAFNAAMSTGDFVRAKSALAELADLARPSVDARAELGEAATVFGPEFRIARLEWARTRSAVHGQIRDLQRQLRTALRDEPDYPELDGMVSQLDQVLDDLDSSLEEQLDAALNEPDAKMKRQLKAKSLQMVQTYANYVATHPFLSRIDTNPFMPLTVHADLTNRLSALEHALA